jgi:glycosyltransferase involved in cell wall biosynthesis/GT2 family glycosyltransferase
MQRDVSSRICLVTEELSFGKGSGGIGGAFHELALALRTAGHSIDLIYLPADISTNATKALVNYYDDRGIRIVDPAINEFVWEPYSYERRSYGIFRHLAAAAEPYDFIHFHDYKGLGFASLSAKRQRLAFSNTTLIVQVHGPTRWALQANGYPFRHEDRLKIDFMERQSIARADILVSPSHYMVNWLKQNDWTLPPAERIRVIQNVSSHLGMLLGQTQSNGEKVACREIIFFGRHEERKGIVPFCDALDLINEDLASANVPVTFLGGFGIIKGEASPLYLTDRSTKWRFPIQFLPDFDRLSACRYLAARKRSLVVVPSFFENSPYTVLETAITARPLITSAVGGAAELLDPTLVPLLTCQIERRSLAKKLLNAVQNGIPPARLAIPPEETVRLWLDLHHTKSDPPPLERSPSKPRQDQPPPSIPTVVAAITHYERPAKLYDALMSLVGQTYPKLEIVVVDDGSESVGTLQLLERLSPLMAKLQVRILRQENRYLGAARNHAIANSESDYILFLDDDDIAFPNLVQTLVTAAEATRADVVNCLNLYMPEARRDEAHPFPDQFRQRVSYVPLGGPLSMAPLENCLGAATALIRRDALNAVLCYTEQHGVGHEDFELYVRMLQSGLHIEVCPLPLYLYEVDHAGMISSTSPLRNWNRVAVAVDPGRTPEEWRDLISLVAGRRAQELADNFTQYKIATSPHTDLVKHLMSEPQQTIRYAELLAEYATRTRATSAMQAAHALAAVRSDRIVEPATVLVHATEAMVVPIEREPPIGGLTLGALVDLSFGRVSEAIATLALLSERDAGPASPAVRRLLGALTNCPNLTSAHAAQILEPLKRRTAAASDPETIVPVMFRLALFCHDMDTADSLIESATLLEEKAYLAANPDVADAVSKNEFTSALDHFVLAGDREGRPGFAILLGIKQMLLAHLGVEVPISSMRHYILTHLQSQDGRPVSNGGLRNPIHPDRGSKRANAIRRPQVASAGRAAKAALT